jgi:hypothetical protein
VNDSPSRIQVARRRAADAKRTALVLAAAGFLAVVLLARESHPASSSTGSGASSNAPASRGDDGFDFGSGSVSPSNATPDVQTTTS